MLADRYSTWFLDQDAARRGLKKGYSASMRSGVIIDLTADLMATVGTYPWFARVPTASNIADGPSRGKTEELLALFPHAVRRAVDWQAVKRGIV